MTSPFWMLLLLLPAPTQAMPPGSGRLTTVGGHRCSWETSGEEEGGWVSLLLSCTSGTPPHLHRFWCQYAGPPARCPYHHSPGSRPPRSRPRSTLYWKKILLGLRRRPHPCQGDQPLQTCRPALAEAQLQLVQQGGDLGNQESQQHQADQGRGPLHLAGRDGAQERGPSEEMRSETKNNEEERRRGEEEEEVHEQALYCSEGWTFICSLLVGFLED